MNVNTVYYENCLETMGRMPGGFIDLTVTSPPYDGLRTYNGYSFEFEKVAAELYRVTKHGATVVWVVADSTKDGSESGTSFRQALYFMQVGFKLHDTMIFQKINYVPLTHRRYEQSFEYMFVLVKGKIKTFNPILVPCKDAGNLERYSKERRVNHGRTHSMRLYEQETFKPVKDEKIAPNIFGYATGQEKGHPAMFPEKLAEDHILSWSNEGDLVYDPFCGSGTVPKMATIHWRKYIASEISPEYAPLIESRIKVGKRIKLIG